MKTQKDAAFDALMDRAHHKKICKEHTEYGRHLSDSLCPFAENEPHHTPTPWILGLSENEWGERSIWANKVLGEPQTIVLGPIKQANAEYIVRAVNAHQELIEACKAARSLLLRTTLQDRKDTAVCNQLGEAIAKAEGRTEQTFRLKDNSSEAEGR